MTALQHLNRIPDPKMRLLALEWATHNLDMESDSISEAIYVTIWWDQTPEGHGFWSSFYAQMRRHPLNHTPQ